MSPLLYLVATRPQLLVDHAEAYADLASAEVSNASVIWKRRAKLGITAICSFAVAAILAGVSVMLWAVIPGASNQASWILLATPLLPIGLGIGCLIGIRTRPEEGAFEALRRQLKADMAMLREATIS
jgi:hypothetical protein